MTATTAPAPVVVTGLGQLGSVFSEGFLRLGHPVVPVLRGSPRAALAARFPEPALVLIATGEDDLPGALSGLPDAWRSRVVLVQNELLPDQWRTGGIAHPTVAVVWFEKKAGREVHNVLPTVLCGDHAELLAGALERLAIPHRVARADELLPELVVKNLYILVLNLAGLEATGTAGDLLTVHRGLLDDLAGEILELQRALVGTVGQHLDAPRLLAALETAIASDPGHGLAGRSAPRRLERNLARARRLGLVLPTLERLGQRHLPAARP